MTGIDVLWMGCAAVAAGAVNALAGGGTLITFPALTAVGLPALTANVTNTVALCPGYFGATLAQANDLRDQRARLLRLVPAALIGGLAGGLLVLHTGERVFRALVPYLILLASMLLALQEPLRAWLRNRSPVGAPAKAGGWLLVPIGLAAVYGGYFGAGLSVIVLAVLAVTLGESLTTLNALKQTVALSANVAAASCFVFSGRVDWAAAAVMAVGALAGGALGGRLAGRIPAKTLRGIVVVTGVVVAMVFFFRA
jgi:uncharacterized membrane protein YfcA